MSTTRDTTDILAALDPDALRRRLDILESERRALLVLLRAARAKEREVQRRAPTCQEAGHAK